MTITPLDVVLLIVVSLQVTLMAYMHAPKAKVLLLGLPFPFTVIALSVGQPMDATNMVALSVLFCFYQVVRILHQRFRVPVLAAILLGVLFYIGTGSFLARLLPHTETAFWISCACVLTLGGFLHRYMPLRLEPGHRTPLPLWKKLPIIIGVVCLLLLTKNYLRGFSTLFPIVGVAGAYEARHSLWAVGRQTPIVMLTLGTLITVSRLTSETIGLELSLAVGWVAFLIVLVLLLRPMWTKWDAMRDAEPVTTNTTDPSLTPLPAVLPQPPT
jgi:hypothetical protein